MARLNAKIHFKSNEMAGNESKINIILHSQRTYIIVNLRKNSCHKDKVEIEKSLSCGCADFVKNSRIELCKHIT